MLNNDPNLPEDLVKLLVCPLCSALCESFSENAHENICIACGKTFSAADTNTIILTKEHLITYYQKLKKDNWTAYIKNE